MISLKDYNLNTIRDYSNDQFQAHITQIESISLNNDFGSFGVHQLLDKYLKLITKIFEIHLSTGQEDFPCSKEETVLYDLAVEIIRLCYKHSYQTSPDDNDWENPF
ncbi:MAG: hypothetical protein ACRCTJ_03105 [Brevinema sp.]